MADRIPLVRDAAANIPSELQVGDTLAMSALNVTLQALVNNVLVSSNRAPLVTSAGDFITTSAA